MTPNLDGSASGTIEIPSELSGTGKINIQSRIVPNDGYWWGFPPQEFANVAYTHGMGQSVLVKV